MFFLFFFPSQLSVLEEADDGDVCTGEQRVDRNNTARSVLQKI